MLMLSDSGGAESNNLHSIFRLRALFCYSSEYDHPVITTNFPWPEGGRIDGVPLYQPCSQMGNINFPFCLWIP